MISSMPGTSARAAPRAKVFQPAEMLAGTTTSRIHLLDLSRVGALVYGQSPPSVGTIVRLNGSRAIGAARVAWVDGKRFGVAFAVPLTQSQLDALIVVPASLVMPAVAVR